MDEHAIRGILEGGGGWPGVLVRAGLWLPGRLYGCVMAARRAAYRRGFFASVRPSVPTIAVGNLTAGGSGKTPFTIMLAGELAAMGVKPGILLRGYRQTRDGVSDEAALYRRRCPDAVVETGSDRRVSAGRAIAGGAGALLLDDGFQHLRLGRDLDIVLVDATSPWGGGNTIPGGLLREPRTALREAGAVVITRSDQCNPSRLGELRVEVGALAPDALILTARHRPARIFRLDGTEVPLGEICGRAVVALSGIARPEAFHRTLEDLGATVVATIAGKDHDPFSRQILERALALAEGRGAVVVTTEKDQGKQIFSEYADNNNKKNRVWTLGIELEVDNREALLGLISQTIRRG